MFAQESAVMKSTKLLLLFAVWFSLTSIAGSVQVTPSEFGDAKQPQIAVNARGEIFIVFGNSQGVWLSSSSDGGKSFSGPKRIAEVKGLALGMRRGPRIAANGDSLSITAISHTSGNLLAWHSSDRGATWSKETVVNEVPTSAREGMQGLAGDGNGGVYVVWLDLREKKTQLWGAKSADGGKSWGKNVRIYKSPDETICECCHPSVAFGPKGEIIAMWRNWLGGNRDLYRSISADGGRTFGEAAKLGTGSWPLKGCPMDGGSLAVAGDEIAYVWRRELKVYATTADMPERLIADSGSHPILIPAGENGFQCIYQAGGHLYRKGINESTPTLFAKDAAYASAFSAPALKTSFVVWEGDSGDNTAIFLENLK